MLEMLEVPPPLTFPHFVVQPVNASLLNGQNTFFFMNSETFEEVPVDSKVVDEKIDWIEEGMEVNLIFFKGGVIELVVPQTHVYEISETEPNMKGNTAQGYTKPATLSCGATISVPGYLEQGELIKVDTEKRSFLERANK